jgi:Uma2 family endonuclease
MARTEGTSALKQGERFTLDQWRSWPQDERWELIDGIAYAMSPAPRIPHQNFAGEIFYALRSFLEDKPCKPFIAPADVYLTDDSEDGADTVVQPDVMVVCDEGKVQDDGIHGAPDFVAEVLSESTAYKDWNIKKALYERSGVREYWLVSTETGSVFRYVLNDGHYGPVTEILHGGPVESTALPGFSWIAPAKR